MRSVSSTMFKKISFLGVLWICCFSQADAQTENSPYSRYGIGDQIPSQHILSRGMGGVSAAYADYQSVNFMNPASYSRLRLTTFDFGTEIDSRTIRSIDPPRKFTGTSPIISYVQLGFPLSAKRNWGLSFGLRPLTRINYKIEDRSRDNSSLDSLYTLYEGSGGSYQVHAGTGVAFKNLSLGVNVGYLFGSKDYTTRRSFLPDDTSTVFYYPSKHTTRSNFGGLFMNAGVQYSAKLSKKLRLQLGAYGNVKQTMNASRDQTIETYRGDINGDVQIDSIYQIDDIEGKMIYPASYGLGFILNGAEQWQFGMDYTATKWSEYRIFNTADQVQDSWKLNVGGSVVPNILNPRTYFGRVVYRAGFSFGKDYVKVNDQDLPTWGVSFGAGLPMRRGNYSNQVSLINTALEFGQRGNKENIIRENYFRLSVGLTLSDIWFQKRQYQ